MVLKSSFLPHLIAIQNSTEKQLFLTSTTVKATFLFTLTFVLRLLFIAVIFPKRHDAIYLKFCSSFLGSSFYWSSERVRGDHQTRDFQVYPTGVDLRFTWIRKNGCRDCSGTHCSVSRNSCLLDLIKRTPFQSRSDFKVS